MISPPWSIHPLAPEGRTEGRALDQFADVMVERGEAEKDPASPHPLFGLDEDLEGRVLEVDERPTVDHEDAGLRLLRERCEVVAGVLHVQEEETADDPDEEDAREGLVLGVLGRDMAEVRGSGLAPDLVDRGPHGLRREGDEGNDDRDEYPVERPEDDNPGGRSDRPEELRSADFRDRPKVADLDERNRGRDDDGCERGGRHQPEEGREKEQRCQGSERGDGPAELGLRPGAAAHRRL